MPQALRRRSYLGFATTLGEAAPTTPLSTSRHKSATPNSWRVCANDAAQGKLSTSAQCPFSLESLS
ncbi:MAG: hypothetical protein V7K88_24810 [Nostoc sp.]